MVSGVSAVLTLVWDVSGNTDGVDVVWIILQSVCNVLSVVRTSG